MVEKRVLPLAWRVTERPLRALHGAVTSHEEQMAYILSLVLQSRAARQLMERTQSSNMDTRLDAMKELAKLSADVTFATEFINMDGIIVLTRLVESGTKLLSQ